MVGRTESVAWSQHGKNVKITLPAGLAVNYAIAFRFTGPIS